MADTKQSKPTFLIKTLGCKVNQYESQLVREQLLAAGLAECIFSENPALCVVNTCTVTEQADAKSRQALRSFARKYPNAAVVALGCYAESDSEVLKRIEGVDLVLNNRAKRDFAHKIADLISSNATGPKPAAISRFAGHTRAFVKVQEGCDKFCSYCKVPHVRGRSRSRDMDKIVQEVEALAANGYPEIVLTGIHLGDFGRTARGAEHKLAELIRKLNKIEQLQRIRLSSIDPQEITDRLIEAISACEKACHHLHISVQSGSDRVLKAMNRHYSRGFYLDLAEKLYRLIPDISISTDLMVGFPGETEADFDDSLDLVRQAGFGRVHVFGFSPRAGTPAASLPQRVPHRTIKERSERLREAALAASRSHRRKFVGSIQEVLVEQVDPAKKLARGFSDNYLRCEIDCSDMPLNGLKRRVIRSNIQTSDKKVLYGKAISQKSTFP